MQSTKLRFLSATVLLLVLFSMLMFSVSAADNQEDAASSISEAELWMVQAYEAVLDAESADADVSGLLVRLNDAVELLSEAHMAFDVGDFDDASGYAESTSAVGYAVVSGYDSQSSLRHVHCPRCGKIITHNNLEHERAFLMLDIRYVQVQTHNLFR